MDSTRTDELEKYLLTTMEAIKRRGDDVPLRMVAPSTWDANDTMLFEHPTRKDKVVARYLYSDGLELDPDFVAECFEASKHCTNPLVYLASRYFYPSE